MSKASTGKTELLNWGMSLYESVCKCNRNDYLNGNKMLAPVHILRIKILFADDKSVSKDPIHASKADINTFTFSMILSNWICSSWNQPHEKIDTSY